jgi:hypothetical protein
LEPIVQLPANLTEIKNITENDDSLANIYLIDKKIIIDNIIGINELSIYNAIGQLIIHKHSISESIQIDTKEKGLHLVVLKSDNGTKAIKKLMVY